MNVFEMVFGIVIVACIARVLVTVLRPRQRAREDSQLDERLRRVEALEERVRVLEKIVTDRRYHLARELDDLES